MATSLQFDNNLSCFSCIKWSFDNKIAICGDNSLTILNLIPVVEHSSTHPYLQQSFIPVDNIYDIPNIRENDYSQLMKKLSRDEQEILLSDAVMNPKSPADVARRGFCAAAWSPRGGDEAGRCIIAALCHDFRLSLFSQKLSTFDWFKVCDLTQMYGEMNRFEQDKLNKYKEFCKHCRKQAVVTVAWCPAVFTQPSEPESKQQKYSILATGSKTGNIVLWKIDIPCSQKSDCSVLHEVQPLSCQPSYMAWSDSSGLLAVGYLNGQILIVKIKPDDPSGKPEVASIYRESDLMRISCISFVNLPEMEQEIVLVSKEQYIMAFTILASPAVQVASELHVEAGNTLHATGLSVNDGTIIMSSADGMLQRIQLSVQDSSLQMKTEKLSLDINTTVQPQSLAAYKFSWLIHGVSISPNRAFLAFAARPSSPYDRHRLKRATKVMILPLDDILQKSHDQKDLSKENVIPDKKEFTDELTEQNGLSQRMSNLLRDENVPLSHLADVLEVQRRKFYSLKDCKYDKEQFTDMSFRGLQLKRYEYLVSYHTKVKKPSETPDIASYETEAEKLELEEKDKLSSQVISLVQKSTELLTAIWINKAVQVIFSDQVKHKRNSQGDRSLIMMLDFILVRPWLRDLIPGIDLTEKYLKDLTEDADVKAETCPLCSSCLNLSSLTAICENGHSFSVCSKTLLLCEDTDYRTCSICHCSTLSKVKLKDFSWIQGDENSCNLCDGQLV